MITIKTEAGYIIYHNKAIKRIGITKNRHNEEYNLVITLTHTLIDKYKISKEKAVEITPEIISYMAGEKNKLEVELWAENNHWLLF